MLTSPTAVAPTARIILAWPIRMHELSYTLAESIPANNTNVLSDALGTEFNDGVPSPRQLYWTQQCLRHPTLTASAMILHVPTSP